MSGPEPSPPRAPGEPRRFVYRRRHRLGRDLDYAAVFEARARKPAGPLMVFARPNGLGHHRLGLSIGRRAGPAVRRNRLRRRLREAFRTLAPALPMLPDGTGYDLVVTCRPHDPLLRGGDCRRLLEQAAGQLHALWTRRLARGEEGEGG